VLGRVIGLAGLLTLVAACDHGDGRELRPAGPDQTADILLPTTSTVAPDPAALGSGIPGEGVGEQGLTLRAPWEDEGAIDPKYTCEQTGGTPGTGASPALSWSGVPAETDNLALLVTDLSANGFVHWAMVGLDPTLTSLPEGLADTVAVQGTNGFGKKGWSGPCPPAGSGEHEYLVQVYALDQDLGLTPGFDATDAIPQIESASIAAVSLVGRFTANADATSTTASTATSVGATVTHGPSPSA
jgi:Raf kinase inhibitor-like YbhB/YbcL family protein